MRLLVTNDDGVRAPGIAALARALAGAGHDVTVAAPLSDRSGSGAAVGPSTLSEGLATEEVALEGLEGVRTVGVDAPPALIVLLANVGAFGTEPELVVAGINPGPNTGRACLHSGTVGAALTGANIGMSSLAVSIGIGDQILWDSASTLAVSALAWLVDAPPRTLLNLNVPNLPLDDVRGVRSAALAPFGTVRTAVVGSSEGRLEVEFRETLEELDPGTDTALVLAGYATVTSLVGVRAVEEPGVSALLDGLIDRSGGGSS